MSLNFEEIEKILGELSAEGFFIQDVIQPNFCSVLLKIYKKGVAKNILISLQAECVRINESFLKYSALSPPPRFMMLLRSRIKGSKIESVAQFGRERIVSFILLKGEEKFILTARLWSASGNIFLCRADYKIIDCLFRRAKRSETAGSYFVFPEISKEKQFSARTFSEIQGETYNEKVDLFYSALSSSSLLSSLKKKMAKKCENSLKKLRYTKAKLEKKKEMYEKADEALEKGKLILSNLQSIKKGDEELSLLVNGENVKIKLKKEKSATKNAAFYFDEYKKNEKRERKNYGRHRNT